MNGRFRLLRRLGSGGMGEVWLAEDTHLDDEPVACKFVHRRYAADRCALADLKREVLLTRKLRHPGIVAVYTLWEAEGLPFITMEYIAGQNLGQAVVERRVPFSLDEVLTWLEPLCSALDYAHGQGTLHRDIKPSNVMLSADGTVRLADFGIARSVRESAEDLRSRCTTSGTLAFMSPEQLRGAALDPRSDLYSLACTVYYLLSGQPPFFHSDVLARVQAEDAKPIAHLSPKVNAILLKALCKSPDGRPASCTALFRGLQSAARGNGASGESIAPGRIEALSDTATVVLPTVVSAQPRKRLGQMLCDEGAITQEELKAALEEQARTGDRLGTILVQQGRITESLFAEVLARQMSIPLTALETEEVDLRIAHTYPLVRAKARGCVPLRKANGQIVIAVSDPLDLSAIAEIEEQCDAQADLRIATLSSIHRLLDAVWSDVSSPNQP